MDVLELIFLVQRALFVLDIDRRAKLTMKEILDMSIDSLHEVIIAVKDRIIDIDQRRIIAC